MENTIFILLFLVGIALFFSSMGINVKKCIIAFLFRCLLGIVIIGIANFLLEKNGLNLSVKINEISIGVSGILGIWGVILLYALQYYFTI